MAKKLKINPKEFAWLVAYIIPDEINRVERDLKKLPEFTGIEPFIPTVKIIKKTKKGKHQLEDIPLLFNYGFFKVPRKFAVHAEFLQSMKDNIACIFDWVKDGAKVLNEKLNMSALTDNDIPIATALPEEISRLVKDSFELDAHSSKDLKKLNRGDFIILRGYPWEGVHAEFLELDEKRKEVKVKIEIFNVPREVTVAYDNVFFTVYHGKGYDDSLSTLQSIDEMQQTSAFDKSQFKKARNDND